MIDCIDDSEVAIYPQILYDGVRSFVPENLLKLRAQKMEQELIEKDYKRAIKKSMLDYVLIEESEQERLNVKLKVKVDNKYSCYLLY